MYRETQPVQDVEPEPDTDTGAPTAFDRTLATRFGGPAVQLLIKGQFGKMVANHPPDIVPIPLGEVVGRTKQVPLDYDLLLTARAMGVAFGD